MLKFEYRHNRLKVQDLCLCSVFLCLQYVSIYAAYLYDAVMLYARALDMLLKKYEVVTEEDLHKVASNGTLIIEMLKNHTYESKCLGLCTKTHSGSHLALDISFCNEHSFESGTQRTSSRNSTKVTKNFMAARLLVQL